jgi:transposase InsO family protein
VEEHQEQWPVSLLCDVLDVSRSGYYAWRGAQESARCKREQALVVEMKAIHAEQHKGCYGSPRMQRELGARGRRVCKNTVARLMKKHELRSTTARKFRHTTDSKHSHPVADNVLNQEFEQASPNAAWVSDITYVWTDEGWLYLAGVLDLYSRRVVGWSMSERMTSELVVSAVQAALRQRCPEAGELLHHSDRGSQYASAAFQAVLREHEITCSMSGVGNCYDNAAMESFFATLKKELIHQERFVTRAQARQRIFEYIEVFYNRERLHSALGYQSPWRFEELTAA